MTGSSEFGAAGDVTRVGRIEIGCEGDPDSVEIFGDGSRDGNDCGDRSSQWRVDVEAGTTLMAVRDYAYRPAREYSDCPAAADTRSGLIFEESDHAVAGDVVFVDDVITEIPRKALFDCKVSTVRVAGNRTTQVDGVAIWGPPPQAGMPGPRWHAEVQLEYSLAFRRVGCGA